MIKAILFDLGGVVVSDVFTIFDGWLAKRCNLPIDKVKERRRPIWQEYELGNMDGIDFMQGVIDALHIEEDPERLLDDTFPLIRPDKSVVELVGRLKRSGKYVLGVVSNNSFEWSEHSKETLGLGRYFDAWVVSCDISCKKPGRDIYLFAAEKLGVKPEECIFIDNMPANVQGAIAVGMNALLFRDAEHLESELRSLGVSF
jgi:putative hydrolase of the HAD superfamily